MQGLVQAYVATGDDRFRDFALDRLHFIIEPQRVVGHPSGALDFSGTDPRTLFPSPHEFYMPWQHGALFYGYLAAWKFFGDERFLRICEQATQCVEYAWVTNYPDPQLGLVENGMRFYVPISHQGNPVPANVFDPTVGVIWGDTPLGGAHVMVIGGLMLIADVTGVNVARQRCIEFGSLLESAPYPDEALWSKWHYCVPQHWAR